MNYQKFVGIPFKDGGRDKNGVDCWGLVKLMYKELGIDLPEFYIGAMQTLKIENALKSNEKNWTKLSEPEAPCLVLINISCGVWADHVGFYIGDGKFLHCYRHTGVCIDRLNHWKSRIIGYYKPGWIK